jgi:hypothetical protein
MEKRRAQNDVFWVARVASVQHLPVVFGIFRALRESERVKKTCAVIPSQRKSIEANFSLVNARAFMPSAGEPFHCVIYTICCKFHMCSSFSFRLLVLRNAFMLIFASCPRSTRPI